MRADTRTITVGHGNSDLSAGRDRRWAGHTVHVRRDLHCSVAGLALADRGTNGHANRPAGRRAGNLGGPDHHRLRRAVTLSIARAQGLPHESVPGSRVHPEVVTAMRTVD